MHRQLVNRAGKVLSEQFEDSSSTLVQSDFGPDRNHQSPAARVVKTAATFRFSVIVRELRLEGAERLGARRRIVDDAMLDLLGAHQRSECCARFPDGSIDALRPMNRERGVVDFLPLGDGNHANW